MECINNSCNVGIVNRRNGSRFTIFSFAFYLSCHNLPHTRWKIMLIHFYSNGMWCIQILYQNGSDLLFPPKMVCNSVFCFDTINCNTTDSYLLAWPSNRKCHNKWNMLSASENFVGLNINSAIIHHRSAKLLKISTKILFV